MYGAISIPNNYTVVFCKHILKLNNSYTHDSEKEDHLLFQDILKQTRDNHNETTLFFKTADIFIHQCLKVSSLIGRF